MKYLLIIAVAVTCMSMAAINNPGLFSTVRVTDETSIHKGILEFGQSDVVFENAPANAANTYGTLRIKNWNGSGYVNTMTLTSQGQVGIGTETPDSKLSVKGQIHTQEVKVDVAGAMIPDYVFAENFNLMPISDVARYIGEHKHLPEVPSAAEMEKDGMKLKKMNLLLLKKIEELTLYTIEQEKRAIEQEKRLAALEKKLSTKE